MSEGTLRYTRKGMHGYTKKNNVEHAVVRKTTRVQHQTKTNNKKQDLLVDQRERGVLEQLVAL